MAPVDNSPTGNMSGFGFVCSIKANNTVPVHKYKSINSGINVAIAEIEGPLVAGYLVLATEAHDDDGLPHTLEHLIFLGSEDYPYKGVLDLCANRCYASGTNACTDTDHTYYTMTTAGADGFLTLLPIYLDHILYPTLKDSGFLTEVHHVTGEGKDAGVVYCEMQGLANTGEFVASVELCRAIYPGYCGYKSITGGALKNLRESTTNTKVKGYHKEFYRPENLMVVICGQVKHADVFKALQPIEKKIISKGQKKPFARPWQNPVPPLEESVDLDVEYPCDDESNGSVYVGWRGPSAITGIYDLMGCCVLMKFLTDTSISPLQKQLVQIEDPVASNIAYSLVENSVSMLYFIFENVPKSKIEEVKDRFMKILKNIHGNNDIDVNRMKTVIHRHLVETLSNLESNPHDAIAFMLMGDFLYGHTKEQLEQRLNQVSDLEKLSKEPQSHWLNLLKRYFIDAPMVTVMGIPSLQKQRELTREETERNAKQVELLGEQGLYEKDKDFISAVAENEKPIPNKILTSVMQPSTESIKFHPIKSYTTETVEQHPRFDLTKLPFYTYLDHVNTNFLYMFVVMDTTLISSSNRPYISLLLAAILESPINRNGTIIPYEQVVCELEADTVATSTRIGFDSNSRFMCGAYSNSANLMLQFEINMYTKGVQWVKELLHQTILTPKRLRIIANQFINEVAKVKRKGGKMVNDLMTGLLYNKESNTYFVSLLRQQKFLQKMIERLNDEVTQKEVIAEIESVRQALTAPDHMILYMATNVDKLTTQVPDVYTPWNKSFSGVKIDKKIPLKATPDWKFMNDIDKIPIRGCVTGLGSTESSYLLQCCSCIKDPQHPDLPPLLVCLQYLTQLEGPIWRQVRGQGLSYGYNIYVKPNEGVLYLCFSKSTNVVAAYKETHKIVRHHVDDNDWDQLLYESAKSSLVFKIIEREKSVGDVVVQSLLFYFKDVPHDYNQQLVKSISAVTIPDIQRVATKYLTPLFDGNNCRTSIVCHPSKVTEIAEAFIEFGLKLQIYNSIEESYLNEA